jgi:hypothetical protein
MSKLTQPQRDLLEAAAGGVADVAKPDKTRAGLIRRGFLISIPQEGGASRLMITDAGRAAIGQMATPPEAQAPLGEGPAASAPKSKLVAMIALLERPEGASIDALMEVTGWQAHSVRGAISGALKKARGLTVVSERGEAGRLYRIAPGAGA